MGKNLKYIFIFSHTKSRSISHVSSKISDIDRNKPKGWAYNLDNVKFTKDEEQKENIVYKQGKIEKWINILLCRGDLADETFDVSVLEILRGAFLIIYNKNFFTYFKI